MAPRHILLLQEISGAEFSLRDALVEVAGIHRISEETIPDLSAPPPHSALSFVGRYENGWAADFEVRVVTSGKTEVSVLISQHLAPKFKRVFNARDPLEVSEAQEAFRKFAKAIGD